MLYGIRRGGAVWRLPLIRVRGRLRHPLDAYWYPYGYAHCPGLVASSSCLCHESFRLATHCHRAVSAKGRITLGHCGPVTLRIVGYRVGHGAWKILAR